MSPIALEETWKTTRWPSRVFQFLLAITEVNCQLAESNLYGRKQSSQQSLGKRFPYKLINNKYINDENDKGEPRSKRMMPTSNHVKESILPYHTFWGATLVPVQTEYIQRVCNCGQKRVQSYCSCSPGVFFVTVALWNIFFPMLAWKTATTSFSVPLLISFDMHLYLMQLLHLLKKTFKPAEIYIVWVYNECFVVTKSLFCVDECQLWPSWRTLKLVFGLGGEL